MSVLTGDCSLIKKRRPPPEPEPSFSSYHIDFKKLQQIEADLMSLNITVSMEEVNLDLRMKILTVVELGYGIPSFICMVAFLVMMGSSKVFKSSFYRLVQLDLLTVISLIL